MNLTSSNINRNAPRTPNAPARPQQHAARPQVQQANTLSNYGTTIRVRSLYPGQILRGEVSDLRNTEIVVTLENNTIVAGKLVNGSWLAIGETAAFKVNAATQENIVLEALPRADMSLANSTIQKALVEAGLPKTERNQQIVFELMNNQLPINKQSIHQMLQLSLQNKEISVPTLVLMNKLEIPITKENATQFEAFQQNQHSIADKLYDLGTQLSSFLKDMATTGYADHQDFQAASSKLLTTMLDNSMNTNSFQKNVLPDTILTLSEEQKEELISILDNFELEPELKDAILGNQASLRSTMHTIYSAYEKAQVLDEATATEAFNGMSNENATENNTASKDDTMLRTSIFDSPIIETLENQFATLQCANNELGAKLPLPARMELYNLVKELPVADTIKDGIKSGEINTTELLRTIKNVIGFSNREDAAKLLSSEPFTELLRTEFIDSLFLTPPQIFKQGGVNEYYQKLSKHIDDWEELLRQPAARLAAQLAGADAANHSLAKENVSNLKDNLDFMKILNQFFSYVQLPVNLKGKATHTDLYVYTKKKNLAKQQNPIHVLLRLDMEHLGAMDIDVKLNNKTVTAKFAMNNEKAMKLIDVNKDLLEQALLEKGYLCNTTVEKLEKEVDLVKDFIEDTPSVGISRYSFDLRA